MRQHWIYIALLLCSGAPLPAQPPMKLTIEDAKRLALQNNPAISVYRFRAAAAHQAPNEFRANLEPNFTANLTGVGADSGSRLAAGALNNPVVYNRVGTGVSLSQMLFDFGRTRDLIHSSQFHAQAEDQLTEASRQDVLLETEQAYFAVLRAHAVLQVAEETVKARQLVSDQVTALARASLKSALDVSFANVNLADAKLLLSRAQNDWRANEANLATAIGLPNADELELADVAMPEPLPDRIDALVRQAVRTRPEVRSLRFEQSSAERFAMAERALYFPTVSLMGAAGVVPAGQAVIPGSYGAVGLNVSVPIFNGGLFKARRLEAEMRARAVSSQVADLENRLMREVRVAYLNATTAFQQMDLNRELLTQARLALELADSRYKLGLSSIIELSQAQLNLTSAQIANSSAIYEYERQRAVVDYQTGALK